MGRTNVALAIDEVHHVEIRRPGAIVDEKPLLVDQLRGLSGDAQAFGGNASGGINGSCHGQLIFVMAGRVKQVTCDETMDVVSPRHSPHVTSHFPPL